MSDTRSSRRLFKATRAAERLAWRFACLAWWREQLRQHPGGLVPASVAADWLALSGRRLKRLIADGRVPVVECPLGGPVRWWVPVDALLSGPDPLATRARKVPRTVREGGGRLDPLGLEASKLPGLVEHLEKTKKNGDPIKRPGKTPKFNDSKGLDSDSPRIHDTRRRKR